MFASWIRSGRVGALVLAVGLSGLSQPAARGQAVSLEARRAGAGGAVRLESEGRTNQVHRLERSTDLQSWQEAATLQDGPLAYTDFDAAASGTGVGAYFRVRSRRRTATDDGKNGITLPEDRFANEPRQPYPAGQVRWIKFALRRDDPSRVWFQDSAQYPFHHDFARLRLPPFVGMSRADFDARTLYRSNQLAVLGAILLPPASAGPEYGIQLVGLDTYPREEVAGWLARVQGAVAAPPGTRALYVPTLEQEGPTRQDPGWFAARGIEVASADRWLSADACYSSGWAVGRLVYLPPGEIAAAYGDGRLRPTDVLVTDRVPAEVPFVAGILTLAPATPNSHVALLARSYGVPFAWPASASARTEILGWTNRVVAFWTTDGFVCEVRAVDTTGTLDPALREEMLALQRPAPIQVTPKARLGTYVTNTLHLQPADVRYVGGKAAQFGLLRRVLPTNSPPALALTFDLWDDFLAQPLAGGRTLREEIAARLGGFAHPPDVARVRAELAAVRDLIRQAARFTPAQQAAVVAALQAGEVPTGRKIRFRSSTNVEDTAQFTGAGLYDSFSGCLLDDLDGDEAGPSACDPGEAGERGVFRAIQRVYASFYNENAFLERLRLGVLEDQVGMAVLVHESFPDEDELANGVATLDWSKGFGTSKSANWEMVTQVGAESVANPDSAARPESVGGWRYDNSSGVLLREASARVPLGGYVMAWEADYLALGRLFNRVADGYALLFPARKEFTLDFEYKKSRSRGLQVKQVRELPRPQPAGEIAPFLLDEPAEYVVEQGERGDLFALHRLKSRWSLATHARRLGQGTQAGSVFRSATVRLLPGNDPAEAVLTHGLAAWEGYRFEADPGGTRDSFEVGAGASRRRLTLSLDLPGKVPAAAVPLRTQRDLSHTLTAGYAVPQPSLGFEGPVQVTNETVRLVEWRGVDAGSLRQERRMTHPSGWRVETTFWWPEPPRGPSAGYTAPCLAFVETRLTGFTAGEIVLRGGYSQTYHPWHHNFAEEFLFEPGLEPGLPDAVRQELAARNVRAIYVAWDFQVPVFRFLGWDGKLRERW